MILLDTHIWIWWIHGEKSLPKDHSLFIEEHKKNGLGVSAISCWEVAKLVEKNRLHLPCPTGEWISQALAYPHIHLLDLAPAISVQSTELPGAFHKDPADQIIVATSRVLDIPLEVQSIIGPFVV